MIAGPAAAARFWKPEVRACETAMMNRAKALLVFFSQAHQVTISTPGRGSWPERAQTFHGLLPWFLGSGLLAESKIPSKGATVDSREKTTHAPNVG